jgi:hypothetical protein
MKQHPQVNGAGVPVPVETDQASRLLRVGLRGPSRPVDRLLDRLAEPDGKAWLAGVLSDGPLGLLASAVTQGDEAAITMDHLRSIKEIGKTSAIRADTRDATLRAMVGYFFSIGVALARFGTNISSRSAEELDSILMDLASVAPPDWSALFERAWSALDTRGS